MLFCTNYALVIFSSKSTANHFFFSGARPARPQHVRQSKFFGLSRTRSEIQAAAGGTPALRCNRQPFRRGEFHEPLTNKTAPRKWGLVELAPPIMTAFETLLAAHCRCGRAVLRHGLRACAATVTDRRHSHSQSSIFHLRFHNQSGGKMLKFSITALLFVTMGAVNQLVKVLAPMV